MNWATTKLLLHDLSSFICPMNWATTHHICFEFFITCVLPFLLTHNTQLTTTLSSLLYSLSLLIDLFSGIIFLFKTLTFNLSFINVKLIGLEI